MKFNKLSSAAAVIAAVSIGSISFFSQAQAKTEGKKASASKSQAKKSTKKKSPKRTSGSSTSPYYAEEGITLSNIKCDNSSRFTESAMRSEIERLVGGDGELPCNDRVCLNPDSQSDSQVLRLRFLWNVFGINAFHGGYRNARAFTVDELNILIEAVSYLPRSVIQEIHGSSVVRKTTRAAQIPTGPGTYMTSYPKAWSELSSIYVHTRFDEIPRWQKKMILFHELGHVIAYRMKIAETSRWGSTTYSELDVSATWLEAAGWADYETMSRPWLAASRYAKSKYGSAGEDFAESMVRYRMAPRGFLNFLGRNREKYDFLRDHVFQGVEYLAEEQCHGAQSISYLESAHSHHGERSAESESGAVRESSVMNEPSAALVRESSAVSEPVIVNVEPIRVTLEPVRVNLEPIPVRGEPSHRAVEASVVNAEIKEGSENKVSSESPQSAVSVESATTRQVEDEYRYIPPSVTKATEALLSL